MRLNCINILIFGGCVSRMVIVYEHEALLPKISVAVKLNVVVPTGIFELLIGLLLEPKTTDTLQLSEAGGSP